MMNQAFHTLLHACTGRWYKLMVINLDGSRRDFVETLADDPQTLSHFLYAAKISIKAVAILPDRNVKFNLGRSWNTA